MRHVWIGCSTLVRCPALGMAAVQDARTAGEVAVTTSVQAGTDMLLMPSDLAAAHDAVRNAVLDGTISPHRLRSRAVG